MIGDVMSLIWYCREVLNIPYLDAATPSPSPVNDVAGRGVGAAITFVAARVCTRYPSGARRDRGKLARLTAASSPRRVIVATATGGAGRIHER